MTMPDEPIKRGSASWLLVALAWILVGIPLAWGIYRTLQTAVKLF
jgi:hypothetical protein